MGNRADRVRWLVCELEFERTLKSPRKYTKLFFMDEAVALAAGHRPCKTCRRARFEDYLSAARCASEIGGAPELDHRLSEARKTPYQKEEIRSLPDGAFVSLAAGDFRIVWRTRLYRWTPERYVDPVAIADLDVDEAHVMTPAVSLAALRHGYQVSAALLNRRRICTVT